MKSDSWTDSRPVECGQRPVHVAVSLVHVVYSIRSRTWQPSIDTTPPPGVYAGGPGCRPAVKVTIQSTSSPPRCRSFRSPRPSSSNRTLVRRVSVFVDSRVPGVSCGLAVNRTLRFLGDMRGDLQLAHPGDKACDVVVLVPGDRLGPRAGFSSSNAASRSRCPSPPWHTRSRPSHAIVEEHVPEVCQLGFLACPCDTGAHRDPWSRRACRSFAVPRESRPLDSRDHPAVESDRILALEALELATLRATSHPP